MSAHSDLLDADTGFKDGFLRTYNLDSGVQLLETQMYEEGSVSALHATSCKEGILVLTGSDEGRLVFRLIACDHHSETVSSWMPACGSSVCATIEDVLQHRGSQISTASARHDASWWMLRLLCADTVAVGWHARPTSACLCGRPRGTKHKCSIGSRLKTFTQ